MTKKRKCYFTNRLSSYVVFAETVNTFENHLHTFWCDQEGV